MSDWMPNEDWEKLQNLKPKLVDKAYSIALSKIKLFVNENKQGNCKTFSAIPGLQKKETTKIECIRHNKYKKDAIMQLCYFYLYTVIDSSVLKSFTMPTQERVKSLIEAWARCKLCEIPIDFDKLGCVYKKICEWGCGESICLPFEDTIRSKKILLKMKEEMNQLG